MSRRSKPLFQRVTTPQNVRPVVKILKLGATVPLSFLCLSERPWGFTTHWTSKRQTKPCIAHRAQCPHCAEMSPRRDRGYLLAADAKGLTMGFVDLTPDAFLRALEYRDRLGTLRGHWFRLWREPATLRGAMVISQLDVPCHVAQPLPPDQDPEPSLRRIWGLDNVA